MLIPFLVTTCTARCPRRLRMSKRRMLQIISTCLPMHCIQLQKIYILFAETACSSSTSTLHLQLTQLASKPIGSSLDMEAVNNLTYVSVLMGGGPYANNSCNIDPCSLSIIILHGWQCLEFEHTEHIHGFMKRNWCCAHISIAQTLAM